MSVIYLDNNATTRPDAGVVEAMRPYFDEYYGNASSVHRFGQLARKAIDNARASVAELIGARDSELVFTGSGTESVNTAIRGLLAERAPRRQIVTSSVEHSASLELCRQLAGEGFEILRDRRGRRGTAEPGSPGDRDREPNRAGHALMGEQRNGSDLSHPHGRRNVQEGRRAAARRWDAGRGQDRPGRGEVAGRRDEFRRAQVPWAKRRRGAVARRGLRIRPLLIGGPQERGRRGGTENVPGIVGMGKAAELAKQHLPEMRCVANLRDRLERGILMSIADTSVNGDVEHRLPNTSNISFAQLEAEAILLLLSERDVCRTRRRRVQQREPGAVTRFEGDEDRAAAGSRRDPVQPIANDDGRGDFAGVEILPAVIARLRKVMPVG